MVLRHLGTPNLRQLIGKDLLTKIESILPKIDKEIDELALHRKRILADIFSSFTDASHFKSSKFRKTFYNSIPENEIDRVIEATNPALLNSDFNDKVDFLIKAGWKDDELTRSIIDEFHLPKQFQPKTKKQRSEIENVEYPLVPYKSLKQFQTSVYFSSKEKIIPFGRFIIQMPTGSGKTRTSMELICDTFKKYSNPVNIIWLAHSEELCEQAIECFKEVWAHIGTHEINVCRVFSSYNSIQSLPNGYNFIVGGFQKIHSQLKKNANFLNPVNKNLKLIVVDEAHKVLAPTYKEVTEQLALANCCVIGLTATPGRSKDDIFENKKLAEFFYNVKFTIDTPKGESVIAYLKSLEVLSHVKYDELICSTSITLTKKEKEYIEEKFDYPPGFLRKLGEDDVRNLEIIQKLLKYLEEGKQTIYFATSKDQSKFINSILTYMGYKSCHIDGDTDKGSREFNIEMFKNKELQIICNYGVLTTGFDAPQTDLVFIARPTQSIVLYSQMIGRGLRGPAIGGTEKCTICTVKDNIIGLPHEQKIYEYFDEYFD